MFLSREKTRKKHVFDHLSFFKVELWMDAIDSSTTTTTTTSSRYQSIPSFRACKYCSIDFNVREICHHSL